MHFRHVERHPLLKKYIEKIWVFESDGKLPADDVKLVVPNGNLKLTVACRNGIVTTIDKNTLIAKEHSVMLTGLVDRPLTLDAADDALTETIGIELSPAGAYRFFNIRFGEIANQIFSLDDLLGKEVRRLENKLYAATSLHQKIDAIQEYLIGQLALHEEDLIFEFCVERIQSSKGGISIKDLEQKTGYTRRWIDMKFNDKLGTGPKNLSSIIRFRQYYRTFAGDVKNGSLKNDFYEYYYDQSHFIKSFKRFTGLSPAQLRKRINDFGRKFYKE